MLPLILIKINPFDWRTVLLAKHAQHVVLVHFPIALFMTAVAFDLIARSTKRPEFADASYYNLIVAAIATLPVVATGLLAWHFQLAGQKLRGILLLHLELAAASVLLIWLVLWLQARARRSAGTRSRYELPIEVLAVAAVAVTAHLGGFLSGINGPR
jgi:uncharacterized membrane protein